MPPALPHAVNEPAPCPVRTPAQHYIEIMRSYLTTEQKAHLRRLVEDRCTKQGLLSMREYADVLQSFLTPLQRAGVLERLEATFGIAADAA